MFGKFYERLKEVREYHRRFPNPDLTEVRGLRGQQTQRSAVAVVATGA